MQDIDKNLNSGPLAFKLKKCVDPRVDTEELNSIDNEYIGYVGAQNWNRYSIPATVYNTNEIKFTNIQSPGPNVLWDKKWWIEYCIDLDITNIPATGNTDSGFIGSDPAIFFRPYPIHQTTNTIQIRLNNRDIQSYPMDTLNARMEYWPQDKLKLSCGCCPHRKYNGQTFADCSIRAGNSPYGDMKEFTDQDYPNSTICNIEELTYTKGEILTGSNFERGAPMKGYRIKSNQADIAITAKKYDGHDAAAVLAKYNDLVHNFATEIIQKSKDDGGKYGGVISHTNLLSEKKTYTGSKGGGYALINLDLSTGEHTTTRAATFRKGDLLDADFLSSSDLSILDSILEKNGTKPIVYWSGAAYNTEKMGKYHLRARIREPIIAEPLDFTSSTDFGRSMWNISTVEVRFSFDNYMKNMIAIDRYKLEKNAEWYWAFETIRSLYENADQNILNDSNINISFVEAPRLIYNIATPFVPPNCPFICAHKQFQIFESHLDNKLNGSEIDRTQYKIVNNNTKKITTVSDAYPLQFHPNALYLWVAERKSDRYDAKNRYTRVDSYAKITGIRITYGNTSNILAQFDDHELFQMSLRNGLKDRTFLDWNAVPKSICVPLNYNNYDSYYGVGGTVPIYSSVTGSDATVFDESKHYFVSSSISADELITYQRYAGIGSVIKLIPGIDILTGDTTNPLVAGMHAYSATIKIEVDFIPLNLNEKISYSLYTMFEYDGVCTISAQSCDLGMIAIESWAQLKATPKARTVREDAYGSGLGGSTLNWLRKARAMASNFRSKFGGDGKGYGAGAINGNSLTSVMEGGRLISPHELNARFGKGHGGSFYKPY